ncbi:hypothetical protein [Reichenbachiella ulvae]|uniref:DUF2116 family Zn-ribbon domain-containing protein n=1 Tax=Reichenbachiella ulvae TaxID=2980104 RepID=A0ABT3CUT4_9BACT|nr:hypothetical protein [Reichenbachiella ulvae]MCV9386998.1 hypothetical protein [Reichenbachiella ulvae]
MDNTPLCLSCNRPLVGRIGKKFCDAQCRNSYHNQHKRPDEKYMQEVNSRLRQNRRILRDLCPEGKATVRRDILEALHFDFNQFTSIYPTQKGVYYLCYDYGYMPIVQNSTQTGHPTQKVLIIQKQDFMNQPFDPWKYLK